MRVLSIVVCVSWVLAFVRTLFNLSLIRRLRPVAECRGCEATDSTGEIEKLPGREAPGQAGDLQTPGATATSGKLPRVSVIIPARDEERVIGRTVAAFLAQTYGDLEVIVVNDRSTDRTAEILRRVEDPRLIVVDGAEPPPGWLGKPWALHQGGLRAGGELLLFVDADVLYAPEGVAAAVDFFRRRDVGLLALLPYFEMRGLSENAAMPQLAMAVLTYFPTWFSNRTTIGALAIGGGPGNLVGREVYDATGGHEALKDAVVDDVALARLVRRRTGLRTEVVRADDLVSLRMYEGLGEIVRGFTKNAFATLGRNYVFGIVVTLYGVIFHMLPYGLAVAGDRWALASVVLITLTRVVLFRSLRYPLASAVLLHPVMLTIWTWIFVRSIWYTGVRRELRWRGRRYDARATRFGAGR